MQVDQQISLTYKQFSLADGSQHIASEYAIRKLQELVKKFHIKNVLEIGLGIGSIAGCILTVNKNINYVGTEANGFCLNALLKNLKEKFDLIIIDGKDPDLHYVKQLLAKNAIIAVEGDRLPQQKVLQEIFNQHKMVHVMSLSKNKSYSPFSTSDWQGGLKIIFVNPSGNQYASWLKEKILNKLKYQYRAGIVNRT